MNRRFLFSASTAVNPVAAGVASPCVSVCTMNARTSLCDGCLRTIDEIAHWGLYDDEEKRAVWAQLAERRQQLPG
jgi:predicted Fe-S protein YdhL (DUF1289 family)